MLLIGGVNVANLMLVRSNVRLRELGMRHALGAGRGRLARQVLTESVVLTTLAAVCGLAVGLLGLQSFGVLGADQLPRGSEIAIDGVVVAVTLAVALMLGVVLGLVPVVKMSLVNLQSTLRQESRSGTTAHGGRMFRNALVVAQISIAFVLLFGAMLLLVSFQRKLSMTLRHQGSSN